MNYNSVQEILDAGISNMTVLVNNSGYDDNSYSVTAPAWLVFNGLSISTIYANGNSFLALTSPSTENIQVNRRDAKMYYLYSEEGTLFSSTKFFKIRWRGYSRYNYSSSSYLTEYDVIFWDTGDISLHMVNIPTSYYNGTFNIVASTTVNYTAPTTALPDVTFYTQDENNTVYTVVSELITIEPPYSTKYLVRSSNLLYTVVDDSLTLLDASGVTAQLFVDQGADTIPVSELLLTLVDPEVLCCKVYVDDSGNVMDTPEDMPEPADTKLFSNQTAVPFPQLLYSPNYDMSHETITGIEVVTVEASTGVLFCVSFDGGITWLYQDSSTWVEATEDSQGMDASTLAAITSDSWATVATTGTIQFRMYLPTTEDYFTSLVVDYLN